MVHTLWGVAHQWSDYLNDGMVFSNDKFKPLQEKSPPSSGIVPISNLSPQSPRSTTSGEVSLDTNLLGERRKSSQEMVETLKLDRNCWRKWILTRRINLSGTSSNLPPPAAESLPIRTTRKRRYKSRYLIFRKSRVPRETKNVHFKGFIRPQVPGTTDRSPLLFVGFESHSNHLHLF